MSKTKNKILQQVLSTLSKAKFLVAAISHAPTRKTENRIRVTVAYKPQEIPEPILEYFVDVLTQHGWGAESLFCSEHWNNTKKVEAYITYDPQEVKP